MEYTEITYQITEEDYTAFNQYYAAHDLAFRRRVRLIQLGGVVFLLALGVIVGQMRGGVTAANMAIFVIGALLFWIYVPFQARSTVSRQGEMKLEEAEQTALGARTIMLMPDGLRIEGPHGRELMANEDIEHVVRTDKHIFVLTRQKDVLVVPVSAFETEDESQVFFSDLKRQANAA